MFQQSIFLLSNNGSAIINKLVPLCNQINIQILQSRWMFKKFKLWIIAGSLVLFLTYVLNEKETSDTASKRGRKDTIQLQIVKLFGYILRFYTFQQQVMFFFFCKNTYYQT